MKNLLKQILALSFACVLSAAVFAQKAITGTVTNDSAKAMAGVVVQIQGSTVETLTGQDGTYAISAGDESILVFKMPGYITQEIEIHGRTQIDVVMLRNMAAINNSGLLFSSQIYGRNIAALAKK